MAELPERLHQVICGGHGPWRSDLWSHGGQKVGGERDPLLESKGRSKDCPKDSESFRPHPLPDTPEE